MNEGAPKRQEQPGERVPLALHNEVQVGLATRYFGFEPSDDQMLSWVQEHAAAFRGIVDSDPRLLRDYANDPEHALDGIERALHEAEEKRSR